MGTSYRLHGHSNEANRLRGHKLSIRETDGVSRFQRPHFPTTLFVASRRAACLLGVIRGRLAAEIGSSNNCFGCNNNRYIPVRETLTSLLTFPNWLRHVGLAPDLPVDLILCDDFAIIALIFIQKCAYACLCVSVKL